MFIFFQNFQSKYFRSDKYLGTCLQVMPGMRAETLVCQLVNVHHSCPIFQTGMC
jgi:hypothetical protein